MTIHENGRRVSEWQKEASLYSNPEWETHEVSQYSNPEMEWETPEAAQYSNPEWETPEVSQYSNPEMEWETPEAAQYSNPEWETPEASRYSNPEMEWETPKAAHYSNPESEWETRAVARRLIPCARAAIKPVISAVVGRAGMPRSITILLNEGEGETSEFEAQMFGANEFEGEVAAHEGGHEAALTEVLAAEAAHTESESEAEALLGAALPITIRIMGGGGGIQRVTPTLARANARLVGALHRGGRASRQLVRLVPSIQRRTVASLRAAQRRGQPLTPALAAQVMAGQAARVLNAPRLCGRGLVRNAAIRRTTVAPPRRTSRPY